MCCFSRPVESVSSTRIFARDENPTHQFLAYSMSYRAAEDLAMVLPIPVPPGSREDAVRFIDLHAYADFFSDLHSGFPEPDTLANHPRSRGPIAAAAPAPLKVERVGSFEASFVPQIADFGRLDARFQLPKGVWDKLPAYARYGFAVFKLRKDATGVHPMAFSFPKPAGSKLFFPTVHIHDGSVHDSAHFDHDLYCQVGAQHHRAAGWRESPQNAGAFMQVSSSRGLIDAHAHCYLKRMVGTFKNQDTWV